MNLTAFFTLPFYSMPDQSKGGMDPAVGWFEINPTCSPVFITEGTGLIFHKSYIHKMLPIRGLHRSGGRPACRYNSGADARLHRVQLRTVLEMNTWTRVTGDWKVAEPAGWKACAT
jgi:hypothetical protein